MFLTLPSTVTAATEQKTSLSLCWWCTYTAFKLDDRLHKVISLTNNSNEKKEKRFIKHINVHCAHFAINNIIVAHLSVVYGCGLSLCLIMALVVGFVDKLVALRSAARIIVISLVMAFVVVVVLCLLNRCTNMHV